MSTRGNPNSLGFMISFYKVKANRERDAHKASRFQFHSSTAKVNFNSMEFTFPFTLHGFEFSPMPEPCGRKLINDCEINSICCHSKIPITGTAPHPNL